MGNYGEGSIKRRGKTWELRYYETVLIDGKPVRKQAYQKLAKYGEQYRTVADVQPLADAILKRTESKLTPESTDRVDAFLRTYLAHCRETLKPSTVAGYECVYRLVYSHLNGIKLRDTTTADVQRILTSVANKKARAHTQLKNVRSFLSGAFRWAVQTGQLNSNPVRDASAPRGKPANDTHASTLSEISATLAALGEPARTAVLVAALTGLRHSEIRGLRWEDFKGDEFMVNRAVWQSHVTDTKTLTSKSAVPLLPIVREALEEHKERNSGDGYVFHGNTGKPLVLANLVRRYIVPTLKKAGLEWHGWHAFRRGLATNLHSLGAPAKTIQAILRHADISTTMAFYVKPVASESQAAMAKMAAALKKSQRTAKLA
jgi:integrase